MKKNLLLRLCLILVVVLTVYSCRTDHFPENETYNNGGQYRLSSSRISLNQSKHKMQLLPQLKNAENRIEAFSKNNIQGKGIFYGNGFSIDTEDVIYIENGSNYHTYTFRIIRDNASADAPVENLLLTPLPDGSYKEFLVIYSLSDSEKIKIQNGEFVDTKDKTQIIELSSENYSNLLSKESCSYETITINISCTSSDHHMPGQACDMTGDDAPKSFTLVAFVCGDDGGTGGGPGPGGSAPGTGSGPGYSGGGGGSVEPCTDCPTQGGSTPPCDTPQVPQGPVDPSFSTGDGGCGTGVPTQPNLPLPTVDPCRKTKASVTAANNLLKNPDVQTQMDAVLKGKISAAIEYAIAVGTNNDGSYDVTAANPGTATQSTTPVWNLANASSFFASGHSHSGGPANPSAGDFYGMLEEIIKPNSNFQYDFVYGKSNNIDEVYALVLNDKAAAIAFLDTYPRAKNYDPVTHDFLKGSKLHGEIEKMKTLYKNKSTTIDTSGENYNSASVGLAYMLEGLNAGISIAKVDANGNLKKINATTEKIGNDERSKISKCP